MIPDAEAPEYDPEELNGLIKPVLRGFADVVFRSEVPGWKCTPSLLLALDR